MPKLTDTFTLNHPVKRTLLGAAIGGAFALAVLRILVACHVVRVIPPGEFATWKPVPGTGGMLRLDPNHRGLLK